ncbi:hypothetical protein ACLOJK_032936 [Asimina triloba]
MEASALFSSLLRSQPSVIAASPPRGKFRPVRRKRLPLRSAAAMSGEHDQGFGGRMRIVDESMIVLRRRMHEMEMMERNYEPPAGWMEWEKRYYTCYDSHVCHVVGLLQAMLMNTRPSLGIGFVVLTALSLPTATVLILLHFTEAANASMWARFGVDDCLNS